MVQISLYTRLYAQHAKCRAQVYQIISGSETLQTWEYCKVLDGGITYSVSARFWWARCDRLTLRSWPTVSYDTVVVADIIQSSWPILTV